MENAPINAGSSEISSLMKFGINGTAKSRNIRIFISSTFQDMQSERDMLVNKVFPRLRQIAYERNVTLTEVDLRWGITEEEAKSSKFTPVFHRIIRRKIRLVSIERNTH